MNIGRYKALLIMTRHYRNWLSILLDFLLHRPVRKVQLRDGRVISTLGPNGVCCYPHLAVLLESEWEVIEIGDEFITLSYLKDMKSKCIYTRGYDIGHLVEIFVDRQYGTSFENKVVIDVGMSNGDSSLYFAKMGARIVIGLEPYNDSFTLALENVGKNGLANVVVPLNLALSFHTGKANLMTSYNHPNTNVLLVESASNYRVSGDSSNVVNATTLAEIINRYNLKRIDLLKMDCEGCEYEVFRHMDAETLQFIQEVHLEFHSGGSEISSLLSMSGFEVVCDDGMIGYLHAEKHQ